MMPTSSMTISDEILWGKLVKSWATGRSYLGEGTTPPPIPRSLTELQAQCQEIGLVITFPDTCKGLAIVQYSPETVTLKLPPKSMVEATENAIGQQNAAYPIPQFYDDFYASHLTVPPDRMLDFHAARIGDYSIRNCG